jgi:hypothetical protein
MNEMGFVCICPEQFMGVLCQIRKSQIEIAFHCLDVLSSYLLVDVVSYQDTRSQVNELVLVVITQKLAMFQRAVSLYTDTAFPLMFVQVDQHYYLASLERHANCFKFTRRSPRFRHTTICQNGAQCFNDGSPYPLATFCHCTDCYFGDQSQF